MKTTMTKTETPIAKIETAVTLLYTSLMSIGYSIKMVYASSLRGFRLPFTIYYMSSHNHC